MGRIVITDEQVEAAAEVLRAAMDGTAVWPYRHAARAALEAAEIVRALTGDASPEPTPGETK